MTGQDDPAGQVDTLVATVAPALRPPTVRRRDVVLVTGPWLAGVSSVAAALRDRLPERDVVEAEDLASAEAPTAVVFVVSAATALTASDRALLDVAAARTDPVIGVVSKIDVHRHWPQMLQTARDALAAAPRYRDVPWVGVAAAPASGAPQLDDLVAELTRRLDDPAVDRRNRLRAWEFQLNNDEDRYQRQAEATGRRARVALLQQQRDDALRRRRLAKSERMIALRSRIAQAKVQLSYFARKRCSSIRGELAEDAAGMSRRQLPDFEVYVRGRVGDVIGEVDEGAAEHLADVAQELDLTAVSPPGGEPLPEVVVDAPAWKSRQLENRLTMLLGAGFGLGVALTLNRIFAHLAPGLTAAGAAACAVVGLGVAVWVVHTRGLLRDRALLDRWVGEVTATLRSTVEELAALRVVAAESAFTAELTERNEIEAAQVDREVAVLDRELREHAAATARAVVLRDRELPALHGALELVRAELEDSDTRKSSAGAVPNPTGG